MQLSSASGTAGIALTALLALPSSVAAQQASLAPRAVTEITIPGKRAVGRVWTETTVDGQLQRYFSVSRDGVNFSEPKLADYAIKLRYQEFDPLVRSADVNRELSAASDNRLMIVQYWTQGLQDYRDVITELGGEVHMFLANHANVVEMNRETLLAVKDLPFVRAITPFHPAFKLEEELLTAVDERRVGDVTVNLLTTRRHGHAPVIQWIRDHGGLIEHVSRETYFMSASIRYEHLAELAALNEVQWIDRWSAPENDMDKARNMHGANYVETQMGYTGLGVRIETMDDGCDLNHTDLQNSSTHNQVNTGPHGTCVAGIVMGDGTGNASARGAMPDAHVVVADYGFAYAGGSRYAHSGQLVDPGQPYKCVLQTNSWGNNRTRAYTSVSQNMDLILFDHDTLSITQSQSNAGNQDSRPQAWAKNIISVGGIFHFDTLNKNNDAWNNGASIGPAADGRIKPDLASYYDSILTVDVTGGGGYAGGNYTGTFGGTSGATPIVAGHLGLIYQMYSDGLYGNTPAGSTVFENRPMNTTAKALLINTTQQWSFSGANHDLTRVHQGWGHPRLQWAYNNADKTFIVDETDVLENLESTTYTLFVEPGNNSMRITMVFRDNPGTTSSSLHRINNLDLKAVSPSGATYHGNWGLLANMWSPSGGEPNTLDTVENILIQTPESGNWTITVTAAELNQDIHTETGGLDADYALVVSPAVPVAATPPLAPTKLRGRASARRAVLRFKDNSDNETGFEVERADDGVTFNLVGTLPPDTTEFKEGGLSPQQTYDYRVRAINGAGESAYSNTVTVETVKVSSGVNPGEGVTDN